MEKFGKFVAIMLAALFIGVLYAFTLQHLWTWFVVKTLHAPPLGYAAVYGLSLILTLMAPSVSDKATKERDYLVLITESAARSVIVLTVGFLLHFSV